MNPVRYYLVSIITKLDKTMHSSIITNYKLTTEMLVDISYI